MAPVCRAPPQSAQTSGRSCAPKGVTPLPWPSRAEHLIIPLRKRDSAPDQECRAKSESAPRPQMVVPGEYRILFQTQERWRKQRWDRVVWSLEEEIRLKDIKIAHGRRAGAKKSWSRRCGAGPRCERATLPGRERLGASLLSRTRRGTTGPRDRPLPEPRASPQPSCIVTPEPSLREPPNLWPLSSG